MMLSTIICVHNEENGIGKLLRNITNQKLPPMIKEHEIIIIASGCTDDTVPITKKHMAKYNNVTLIEEEKRRGKASALNKGLEIARGDLLTLVPGDVEPCEDSLYHLLTPFRNPEVTVVSGQPVQNPRMKVRGLVGYIGDMTYRIWGRLMKTLNQKGIAAHSSGEFMAIRAGIIQKIPENSAADDSYISIVAKKKGLIKFEEKARVYNIVPLNIREYVNQRRRWLFGHFQTRNLTGDTPTVMDTIIFSNTKTALKVLIDEVSEDLNRIPYLVAAMLLECVVYSLAVIDFMKKVDYGVWPTIHSTKIPLRAKDRRVSAGSERKPVELDPKEIELLLLGNVNHREEDLHTESTH